MSVKISVFKHAFITSAIGILAETMSVKISIYILPFITSTISIVFSDYERFFVVFEVALVFIAFWTGYLALTVLQVNLELTFVAKTRLGD